MTIESDDSAYAFPLLIKHLWNAPLVRSPLQEIVYRDTHRFTYLELRKRVGRLANALVSIGVGFGDTVAVMDWDSHRYLECFYAVPMMGAVLQTVNVRLSPDQILYTLNHAAAETLIVNSDFEDILNDIRDRLTSVKRFIWISDEGKQAPQILEFEGEYEALLAWESAEFEFQDFNENSRATTFYTTGTTGDPKGVFFTHRQLVLHTIASMAALCSGANGQRMHRGDVYMPITPMFHVHAWGIPYIALQLGVKQVYPGRYLPDALLGLIERENVTFSHCVPTILQMLLTSPRSAGIDLSGWKVIIGGSALPVGLAREARKRGIDVFGGYGMSETCPILTVARVPGDLPAEDLDGQADQRIRTGYPVPLVDLHTVDGDLLDTPRDGKSSGEIVVRAPWLTMGYLHNPSASDELWAGGYLHTGDIGVIDPAGCLQVTDRLKDVIKTGGEWVSSLELENIISQHPAVSEVAVVGVKDDKWGERPLAMVVLKPGQTATADEIKATVAKSAEAGHISRYAVPDEIRFVEELARTSVGKINKKAIREHLA